jgi:mannose-6-phosphate isomerase-like protein (cupin superfamily)
VERGQALMAKHGMETVEEAEEAEERAFYPQAMAQAGQASSIMLEGQEEGDPQHDKMGVYELVEGKEVNRRGVWQKMGGGGQEYFMYYGSNQEWFISGGRAGMEAGEAAGAMNVASTALTPDQSTEMWMVVDGQAFVDAPKVKARVYSAEEKRAAAGSLEHERQQAMAQAGQTSSIMLEGQEEGGPQHGLMGEYELVEGKEVNRRGVWQKMEGGQELFMYYASTKKWYISGRESMEAGKAAGAMRVASTALTPDQSTEMWMVVDGQAFVDAPKVKARMYSADEKRAEAESLEQEQQQAMAQAGQTSSIMLEGQEEGDHMHVLMGEYELVEGKEVNRRGVWQKMGGGQELFMYYASNTKEWYIYDRETMEAGKDVGVMKVASTALTPDQSTEMWMVCDGQAFVDAPKVKARMYSAEEKRAAAERLEQEQQQAMAQAGQTSSIMLEGQEEGDHMHVLMGEYELVEGKEVNRRGVWQKMGGGEELFMNYGSITKEWYISGRESMEAGGDAGVMKVASTALTPDQSTETWMVVDGQAFVDAPKVKARVYGAEEKHAVAERLEQGRVEAVRKEEAVIQQQQREGRVVFKRVRGAVGGLDAAADYTVTFREFATAAAPTAKVGIGSKIFYEFEVLQIGPRSYPQAGFASDRFDLTIDGESNSGVGDDTCRYSHSINTHHSYTRTGVHSLIFQTRQSDAFAHSLLHTLAAGLSTDAVYIGGTVSKDWSGVKHGQQAT